MANNESQSAKNLAIARKEMGRGWPRKLMEKTGLKRTYCVTAVRDRRADALIWDAVEEVKREYQEFLANNTKKMKKIFQS